MKAKEFSLDLWNWKWIVTVQICMCNTVVFVYMCEHAQTVMKFSSCPGPSFFCLFLIWKANICGIFILHIANAFCSRLFMQQILYYYIMWLLFFSVIIGTCYMFSTEGLQMKISCLSNKEYLHLCISYWYSMVCAYIVGARCLRIKIGHLVWHMKPDYTVRAINTAL